MHRQIPIMLLVLLLPATAAAECRHPERPVLPEPTEMTEVQLHTLEAQSEAYMAALEEYRDCLLAAANKAVRDKTLFARRWRATVMDFERR